MPPPYLPAYLEQQRRRKSGRGKISRSRTFVLLACAFLAYVGWRRFGTDDANSASHSWSSRRDLKERRAASDAALFNANGTLNNPLSTAQTFPATSSARRLLLATHSRLMWYHYDTQELRLIHEGQGIYYGGFSGEEVDAAGVPTTVWVISRPHNWRPASSQEYLIQLDAVTGKELQRKKIDSKFTHDTVRRGNRVYAADCGRGAIVELEFPSMKQVRRMELFTEKEHVNTLSPTADGKLWAMLHNLGPSILAEVDLSSGQVSRRLTSIGLKSHGAVQWRGGMIALDSENAALMSVDLTTGFTQRLWAAPESRLFFKGLTVVDDIAFFGIAIKQSRENRANPDLNCELAAFDLAEGVLLWRRQLPTKGLLNVVAAPHLQVESTAQAVWINSAKESYRATSAYLEALAKARSGNGNGATATPTTTTTTTTTKTDTQDAPKEHAPLTLPTEDLKKKLTLMELEPLPSSDPLFKFPPVLGGRWASGYPRLDLENKNRYRGLSAGAQLLLYHENVVPLRDYVLGLPLTDWAEEAQRESNAWLVGRSGNLNQFKPGTSSIHLLFSDQDGIEVFEFPWYRDRFKPLIEPLMQKLLGDDAKNIIRMQLAYMPGGTHIKRHLDKGGYSNDGHRLHIIVASSPAVSFHVCEKSNCVPMHVEEGLVFELNNRLDHYVDNDGNTPRVHLVVDVSESPRDRKELKRGEVCRYLGRTIACGEEAELDAKQ